MRSGGREVTSAAFCQGPAARASMDKKTPKKNRHSERGGGLGGVQPGVSGGVPAGVGGCSCRGSRGGLAGGQGGVQPGVRGGRVRVRVTELVEPVLVL